MSPIIKPYNLATPCIISVFSILEKTTPPIIHVIKISKRKPPFFLSYLLTVIEEKNNEKVVTKNMP